MTNPCPKLSNSYRGYSSTLMELWPATLGALNAGAVISGSHDDQHGVTPGGLCSSPKRQPLPVSCQFVCEMTALSGHASTPGRLDYCKCSSLALESSPHHRQWLFASIPEIGLEQAACANCQSQVPGTSGASSVPQQNWSNRRHCGLTLMLANSDSPSSSTSPSYLSLLTNSFDPSRKS